MGLGLSFRVQRRSDLGVTIFYRPSILPFTTLSNAGEWTVRIGSPDDPSQKTELIAQFDRTFKNSRSHLLFLSIGNIEIVEANDYAHKYTNRC